MEWGRVNDRASLEIGEWADREPRSSPRQRRLAAPKGTGRLCGLYWKCGANALSGRKFWKNNSRQWNISCTSRRNWNVGSTAWRTMLSSASTSMAGRVSYCIHGWKLRKRTRSSLLYRVWAKKSAWTICLINMDLGAVPSGGEFFFVCHFLRAAHLVRTWKSPSSLLWSCTSLLYTTDEYNGSFTNEIKEQYRFDSLVTGIGSCWAAFAFISNWTNSSPVTNEFVKKSDSQACHSA